MKKIKILVAISLFVLWVAFGLYKRYQIVNHFNITVGQVYHIGTVLRQSNNRSVLYEYYINGKKYSGANTYSLCGNLTPEKLRTLINKQFPVAYSTKDFSQSGMIITLEDAEIFKYKIPDSLLIYDALLTCK